MWQYVVTLTAVRRFCRPCANSYQVSRTGLAVEVLRFIFIEPTITLCTFSCRFIQFPSGIALACRRQRQRSSPVLPILYLYKLYLLITIGYILIIQIVLSYWWKRLLWLKQINSYQSNIDRQCKIIWLTIFACFSTHTNISQLKTFKHLALLTLCQSVTASSAANLSSVHSSISHQFYRGTIVLYNVKCIWD